MSDRKFVRVEQQNERSTTPWMIDLGTVVRMCPDARYVIFEDGAAMCLTEKSTRNLMGELEGLA
ncbi:hypothetical protein [uncultured Adlercreutzia sp.]|uniref:hypothetical protein n=1 Tax=uncultured Adlercreutzia sp. TaxID=875803 RepID=UPI002588403E|nr:hypothetical protein [uncultured Adlercreutzia sp.]